MTLQTSNFFAAVLLGISATFVAGAQNSRPPLPAGKPEPGVTAAVDYRDPATWICRPGVDDGTCSAGLDAAPLDGPAPPRGDLPPRRGEAATPPSPPPIDCFYVYPTASLDATMYSDMAPDQAEKSVVNAQLARFGAQCRLFVPIYHQVTIAALRWRITQVAAGQEVNSNIDIPYRDILAAWNDYLQHDNHGRGVVLISHSQGSRLLKRLIAQEIDDKPARAQLVAAYLAGNSDLDAASFRNVPPCRTPDQTGCVVAWSSYPESYDGPRVFGGSAVGGLPLCVNPAALAGGRGTLKAFVPKAASAPAGDPPFVEITGPLSAECVADGRGAVVRVRIEPGAAAERLSALLRPSRAGPSWGLHPLDMALFQGNIVDSIGRQGAAWAQRR